MLPRLPTQAFSSFIAFSSCSKKGPSTRAFSVLGHSARNASLVPRPYHKRPSDKRAIHATAPLGAPKNPYKVLGVEKAATSADIKKAYFALARKYHPDTNPDKSAQDKFVEIQEAYDTLKDDSKRAAFDRYGAQSQQEGFDPNFANFRSSGGSASTFEEFANAFGRGGGGSAFRSQTMGSDMFEQLFGGAFAGGGRASRAPSRGSDLDAAINISFMEACKGTTTKVHVHPITDCGTCSGSGLKAGAKRTTCGTCGGSGTQTFVIESGFQMASTCRSCDGVGSTIPSKSQCGPCGGVGKVRTKKILDVTIPAGVEDGMTIRMSKQGDAPISGKGAPGDLLVRVNVAASKIFTRQGTNLFHEVRIPMHTAILGGKVRVPTLDGNVDVRVPGGTQPGEEMVLKGRGIPRVSGSGDNGDLFIAFSVILPRSLNARQRELMEQYAKEIEGTTSDSSSNFNPSQERPAAAQDNGTASFTTRPSPSPSPSSDGLASRAWKRIRGLIGL